METMWHEPWMVGTATAMLEGDLELILDHGDPETACSTNGGHTLAAMGLCNELYVGCMKRSSHDISWITCVYSIIVCTHCYAVLVFLFWTSCLWQHWNKVSSSRQWVPQPWKYEQTAAGADHVGDLGSYEFHAAGLVPLNLKPQLHWAWVMGFRRLDPSLCSYPFCSLDIVVLQLGTIDPRTWGSQWPTVDLRFQHHSFGHSSGLLPEYFATPFAPPDGRSAQKCPNKKQQLWMQLRPT